MPYDIKGKCDWQSMEENIDGAIFLSSFWNGVFFQYFKTFLII